MTTTKAAKIAGCSRFHIYTLMSRGVIPHNVTKSGSRKTYDVTMGAEELKKAVQESVKRPGSLLVNRKARKRALKNQRKAKQIPVLKPKSTLRTSFADALWFAKLDVEYQKVLKQMASLSVVELSLLWELAKEVK